MSHRCSPFPACLYFFWSAIANRDGDARWHCSRWLTVRKGNRAHPSGIIRRRFDCLARLPPDAHLLDRRRPADRGGARLRARAAAARRARVPAPPLREANLAVLRGQRRDIENDVALGLLPKDARESGARRARRARRGGPRRAGRDARRPRAASRGCVAAFFARPHSRRAPSASTSGWALPRRPTRRSWPPPAPSPATTRSRRWSSLLEQKMKERPDDVQGWSLLARSYAATGKPGQGARRLRAPREDRAGGCLGARRLRRCPRACRAGATSRASPCELVMRALAGRPAASQGARAGRHGDAEQRRLRRLAGLLGTALRRRPAGLGGRRRRWRNIIEDVRGARRGRRKAPAAFQGARRAPRRAAQSPAAGRRAQPAMAPRRPRRAKPARRQVGLGHGEARRRARGQDLAHRHALHLRARRDRLAHPARHPARRRRRAAEVLRARRLHGHVARRDALRARPRWSSRRASRRPAARSCSPATSSAPASRWHPGARGVAVVIDKVVP